MAVEDLTTWDYTYNDDELTITSSKVSWAGMRMDDECRLTKDFGADFFEDFEHTLKINTTILTDMATFFYYCGDTDQLYPGQLLSTGAYNGLIIYFAESGGLYRITIRDTDTGGVDVTADYGSGNLGTRYLKITKVSSTGVATVYIYTDEEMTNLEDTLTKTQVADQKYRYGLVAGSYDLGYSAANTTGYTENADFGVGGASSISKSNRGLLNKTINNNMGMMKSSGNQRIVKGVGF